MCLRLASLLLLFVTTQVLAQDLSNKSTLIGDAISPSNPFVVCIVKKGIEAAYENSRKVLVYGYSGPVGNDNPPQTASITFVTEIIANGIRNEVSIELKSTDVIRKWQYFRDSSNELYLFSTSVSPIAILKDADSDLPDWGVSFDISSCE